MRASADLSNLSYLVVDDNTHMRSILRSILAGFGARRIHEAADGADALESVIDRMPDLVVCDWAMAPVGGADFVRLLRADGDRMVATTPVIVVTAHARRPVIVEAVRLGIHGFIAKPLSPAVLYDRITDVVLRQQRLGRTLGNFKLRHIRQTAAQDGACSRTASHTPAARTGAPAERPQFLPQPVAYL